jgi:hypothetical protein
MEDSEGLGRHRDLVVELRNMCREADGEKQFAQRERA